MADDAIEVRCGICGHGERVQSRTAYSLMEDLHRAPCGIQLLIVTGSMDDLLDLPPG